MSVAQRREREKEARRNQILDAAEAVFAEKGVEPATMDDIAGRAELSKGTLYLYFKSKDELFLATVVRSMSALDAEFAAAARKAKTGLAAVQGIARAYLSFALRHAAQFRIGLAWISGAFHVDPAAPNFDEYRRTVQQVHAHALAAIERGRKDGTVRDDVEPFTLAMQTWASTVGILTIAINAEELERRVPTPVRIKSVVEQFDAFLTRAIEKRGRR